MLKNPCVSWLNPYFATVKVLNSYVETSLQPPSYSREGEGTSPVKQIAGKVILEALENPTTGGFKVDFCINWVEG